MTGSTDWEDFFSATPVPTELERVEKEASDFVRYHLSRGKPVALVSSGGTAIPIELNTVRFIDNFSSGQRGSASTEYLLQEGYAVIFLHRKQSKYPFTRRVDQETFLQAFLADANSSRVTVREGFASQLHTVLQEYQNCNASCSLLSVPFLYLSDYLWYLRTLAHVLSPLKKQALLYLAAAVSDFYIPKDKMPEHKVQSDGGPLKLELQLVPKMLKPLVCLWCPEAYIVSFKLETDISLLSKKAKEALLKYKHNVVIGNLLQTRKESVIMVKQDEEINIQISHEEQSKGIEIEQKIIAVVKSWHSEYMNL
ncbi:unnamed protein product [Darwinula stevensoni]|uniref:DNA/pantothenate metabolism flavoprotein C-terminal domain-containing protein n=1 Tax=Darwinula stevensoni TaxID=69355 RepID=A0A7R9A1T3_9CRUS|nr:unnamed protein product [Darwinula stevensoni]CAG0884274.1 unnamed protein product [Darwinula stevensoni]